MNTAMNSELKIQSMSHAPARRPRYKSSIVHRHRPRVLFVEDDPDDQWLIGEAAKVVDIFEASVVSDGYDLLKLLQQALADRFAPSPASLIVLDLAMPQVDGFTVLRRLEAHSVWAQIPVVVLSSTDNPFYARFCETAGAAGYFIKPPGFHQFCQLMSHLERYLTHPPPPLSVV